MLKTVRKRNSSAHACGLRSPAIHILVFVATTTNIIFSDHGLQPTNKLIFLPLQRFKGRCFIVNGVQVVRTNGYGSCARILARHKQPKERNNNNMN